jgi:hypothetical protein
VKKSFIHSSWRAGLSCSSRFPTVAAFLLSGSVSCFCDRIMPDLQTQFQDLCQQMGAVAWMETCLPARTK